MVECAVALCARPPVGKQKYCKPHYWHWKRTGNEPTRPLQSRGAPLIERFMEKVNKTASCWLWAAGRNAAGYGKFGINGKGSVLAHRWSYEHFIGPVPDGLDLDHLCRVRHCVNPEHLEPVTNQENARRGFSVPAVNARKTHCKHGHEFTPENTYVWTGKRGTSRICRACRSTKKAA